MKSARDLEVLGLRQMERIERGDAPETGCDFMLTWPKPALAARRLAGMANTARGNPLLWIIGLDRHRKRRDCRFSGFEKWQASLRPHFDGLNPAIPREAGGDGEILIPGLCTQPTLRVLVPLG